MTSITHPAPVSAGPARRQSWLVAALLLLCVVPVGAGVARLIGVFGGAPVTPENARFLHQPVPVVVHIVAASLFVVLGPFQFVPALRRRGRRWHRLAGRLLVPCGLAAGLSGLWMTVWYPDAPGDGALLVGFRLVAGTAMVAALVLGLAAILRRDIARHRAWMLRGYALGQGAGTQTVVFLLSVLVLPDPQGATRALLLASGWLINLGVAEWVIRRPRRRVVAVRPAAR
jgi:uncharacterized membrane protein